MRDIPLRQRFGFLGICLMIFSLDQVTKWLVTAHMVLNQSVPVIKKFFNLTFIHNRGVIFGLFSDTSSLFLNRLILVLSIISFLVIAVYFFFVRHESRWATTGFTFVLGGAMGNTWDRLVHGYVTDFLDFYYGVYHWPTFNFADAMISIGIFMLMMHLLGVQWRTDTSETVSEGAVVDTHMGPD